MKDVPPQASMVDVLRWERWTPHSTAQDAHDELPILTDEVLPRRLLLVFAHLSEDALALLPPVLHLLRVAGLERRILEGTPQRRTHSRLIAQGMPLALPKLAGGQGYGVVSQHPQAEEPDLSSKRALPSRTTLGSSVDSKERYGSHTTCTNKRAVKKIIMQQERKKERKGA